MPTTHYIWDVRNDCYLPEKDESDQLTAVFTNEPVPYGRLISQRRGDQTRCHHYDGQQSTRQLSDESGNVTDTATYTAFGKTVLKTGSSVNPFGYKGSLGYCANEETEDVYLRAQTYRLSPARWLVLDPFIYSYDSYSLRSSYAYKLNAPLAYNDPSGMAPVSLNVELDPNKDNRCGVSGVFEVNWGEVRHKEHLNRPMSRSTRLGCECGLPKAQTKANPLNKLLSPKLLCFLIVCSMV